MEYDDLSNDTSGPLMYDAETDRAYVGEESSGGIPTFTLKFDDFAIADNWDGDEESPSADNAYHNLSFEVFRTTDPDPSSNPDVPYLEILERARNHESMRFNIYIKDDIVYHDVLFVFPADEEFTYINDHTDESTHPYYEERRYGYANSPYMNSLFNSLRRREHILLTLLDACIEKHTWETDGEAYKICLYAYCPIIPVDGYSTKPFMDS